MTIDEKLDLIISLLQGRAALPAAPSAATSAGGEVASEADLDSTRGNPDVRKDPKYWSGPSMVGAMFSECAPEYLDEMAKYLDGVANFLDKKGNQGEKDAKGYPVTGKWKRKDAALARGWAKRIRSGWGSQKANAPIDDTVEDLPF